MNQTLTNLSSGQKATIADFAQTLPINVKQRLQDLGLLPNRQIQLIRRTPFGGPISVVVGGLVLALDHQLAKQIVVLVQTA
jgi:Fe2+ transport system protein FeoA